MFSEIERNPHCDPVPVGLRSATDHLFRCWVVDKRGRIKTPRFHVNVSSPLLDVHRAGDGGRITAMGQITIHKNFQKQYDLLYDLYAAEGRLEDWEAFLEYQAAIVREPTPVRTNVKDEFGDKARVILPQHNTRPGLPDDLLPKEVLKRRASASSRTFQMPKSAAQKAAEKKGKASAG